MYACAWKGKSHRDEEQADWNNPLYLLFLAKIHRICKVVAKGVICKCNEVELKPQDVFYKGQLW